MRLMTNDKFTSKLARWAFILQDYEFKVIHNMVLHIKMQIPCRENPSLPLKISQKLGKDFDQIPTLHVFYASSYFTLPQCNLVEHPIVDIWEDFDTLKFFQHGEYPPQVTSSHQDHIQQRSKRYSWRDNHLI
jgi:hypothetical protein